MTRQRVIRRRLELQGFTGLEDADLAEFGNWWASGPRAVRGGSGRRTLLASPLVLWALSATAAVGAVSPSHPFDAIYDHGIRRLTGTRRLPPNGRRGDSPARSVRSG